MRVLVLGSAGQIGSRLCKVLRESKHEVFEYDIATNRSQDLRKPRGELKHLMINSDFVMFLAFDVGGSTYLKSYEKTMEFIDNNIDIMRNTFQMLSETKVPFIFASSQMSNMSWSPYGQLKSIGEHYTHILGGKVVKFWNVYDLETDPEKYHVITDFIISARDRGRIDCKTDGTEIRQFLHGEDAALALESIMMNFETISQKELHITSFKWSSVRDIVSIIGDIYPCEAEFSEGLDTVQLDNRNEPNTDILKYWSPKISLRDGIERVAKEMEHE